LFAVAAAVLIAVVGFGLWELRRFVETPSTNASAPPVIAVLPLTNNSGDPSKDFVAAGIAESLIASLAAVPSVTVLSRSSVAEARTRIKDSDALRKDLGATFFVDGSVQQSGDTLKVSLSLIRSDRSVAWGESLEGTFEKIFELQTRLASALTNALVVRVSASERERMNAQPTTSPEALSAYWQGKALLERSDVKGNTEAAIAAFQRALQIDGRFALAHAALGQSYRRKYVETKDPAWAQQAIDSAANALRLAPESAEVRYVLALTLSGAGRADDAIEELNHALAIQPNFEDAHRQLGLVLAEKGDIDAAIVEFRKAIALRPNGASGYYALGYALWQASRHQEAVDALEQCVRLAPDNFSGYQLLGTNYQLLGDNDRAIENYRKAIAIRPSAPAYSNLGAGLHQRGDFAGAVDAYRQAIAIRPNAATTHRNLGDALFRLGKSAEARAEYLEAIRLFETDLKVNPKDARQMILLAVVYQKLGQPEVARKHARQALALLPSNPDVLYRAATVEALAGRQGTALDYLEQALARGFSRTFVLADDDLESLRSNERFAAMLKREGR
jgi:tetratricopeptide (TPR) repeat protein